jgi:hypothetical protein
MRFFNLIEIPIDVPLTPVTHRPRKTHPNCTTIKYNRKNNPDLEKRRSHYCNYSGKQFTPIPARK